MGRHVGKVVNRFPRKQSLVRRNFILYFRFNFSCRITISRLVLSVTGHPTYIYVCNILRKTRRAYHEKYRSDEFPADPPINSRWEPDHIFNIRAESVCPIDPADGDSFCQNCEQHWVAGRVTIQQVEKVKATLLWIKNMYSNWVPYGVTSPFRYKRNWYPFLEIFRTYFSKILRLTKCQIK